MGQGCQLDARMIHLLELPRRLLQRPGNASQTSVYMPSSHLLSHESVTLHDDKQQQLNECVVCASMVKQDSESCTAVELSSKHTGTPSLAAVKVMLTGL